MENIVLTVAGQPDLSFKGVGVAGESDRNTGQIVRVFETEKGHWLIAVFAASGSLKNHKVIMNKNEAELIKELGFSEVSKMLYKQMGVSYTQKLDV